MEYTIISNEIKGEIELVCQPTKTIEYNKLYNDITYFCYHQLGIRPFRHQQVYFREVMRGNKRIITCTSRQIGKSVAVAVIALWAARFNKFPSGIYKNTKIVIISRSDEQAKKLMEEIRGLIIKGDYFSSLLTGGKTTDALSSTLDSDKRNNMTMITFKNGSSIKCFPPTEACRGETADIVIIDEAKDVEVDIYNQCIKPLVSNTNGIIILTSTPGGQHGLFFELFDPFERQESHEFSRFWFNWEFADSEDYRKSIALMKIDYEARGRLKEFQQEYDALFVVDKSAFFDSKKIDEMIDSSLSEVYSCENDISIGIDYGWVECKTVITGLTKNKEGKLILLFQKAFEAGFDDSNLVSNAGEWSLLNLKNRFNIWKVVVDNCPQGERTNKELKNLGFEVIEFNFRSDQADRNASFINFRSEVYKGNIKIFANDELTGELKALQEEKLKINTSIHAPKGYHDDRVDSLVMASVPFLKDEGFGGSGVTQARSPIIPNFFKERNSSPVDKEWIRMSATLKRQELSMKRMGLIE